MKKQKKQILRQPELNLATIFTSVQYVTIVPTGSVAVSLNYLKKALRTYACKFK